MIVVRKVATESLELQKLDCKHSADEGPKYYSTEDEEPSGTGISFPVELASTLLSAINQSTTLAFCVWLLANVVCSRVE